jgi:hypothetical protein
MDSRLDFWRNPARWPRNTKDYIFLGRAVNEAGRALFPQTWTGQEPTAGADNEAARDRFMLVQSEIATEGEAERLITTCRALPGGFHRSFKLDGQNLISAFPS